MSSWSRFSPSELDLAEEQLKLFSGIEITTRIIPVGNGQHLYSSICGDPSNPPLILLHGFCGAGMIFYKILSQLASLYYIYLVDLLGMGRSSRPNFTATSISDSEDFFVEPLENYRRELGLEKFILIGHSFGGYIAGCYAAKYPQYIQSLIFLSPVGISEQPPGYNYLYTLESKDWKYRWAMKFLVFFWTRNVTPTSIMRKAGPFSGKLLELYSIRKISKIPQSELRSLERYLEQINLLPASGELALLYLCYPGAWAKMPLCKRVNNLKIPIGFLFGDKDWVSTRGAEQLREQHPSSIRIKTISDSGHHLYWDNPRETIQQITEMLSEFERISKLEHTCEA